MSNLPPFFERDGDRLRPNASTASGWARNMMMGRHLAGLVAWGAEQHADGDLQPARLTVDMFRPAPIEPLLVVSEVVRDGRRIRVVDTSIVVNDTVICRGSTAWLRRSATPRGDTWLPEPWSVPDPDSIPPILGRDGVGPPWDQRLITPFSEIKGRRQAWARETRSFVGGEPLTPFVRAALAADNANGQINGGPQGLGYINADLTMTLARLPEGEWIGMDTVSRAAADGVSAGITDLYDVSGRIGQTAMVALADERMLFSEQA